MRLCKFLSCAGLAASLAVPAQAERADAICAVEQVIVCDAYEPCQRGLPGAVNFPTLFKIDHGGSQIVSRSPNGSDRNSPFGSVTDMEEGYVIFGVDEGSAWDLYLNTSSGRFTFSSPRKDVAYIGFGLCASD